MARKFILSMGFGELDEKDSVESLKIITEDGVRDVPYKIFELADADKLKEVVDGFIKAANEMDKQESVLDNIPNP